MRYAERFRQVLETIPSPPRENHMGNNVEYQGQGDSRAAHPKNGHIRVPNEVAEALARLPVSGSQARILWVVLRKTLGWQKSGEWKNESYPIRLADLNLTTGIRCQATRKI